MTQRCHDVHRRSWCSTRTDAHHLRRHIHSGAWDLTALVRLDLEPTRGPLRGFTLEALLSHDGVEFARCTGHASVVSDAAYRRLRGPRLAARPTAASPAAGLRPTADQVGVRDACDVLLARTPEGRLRLHVEDDGHPVWFDHPSDHVPGMVLLEAARQCSRLLGSTTARPDAVPGLTLRTTRFCEWDGPVLLRHEPRPHGARVTFEQDGDAVAEVDLDLP
ncbi:A-factor biosynthesis hotdog domain-containing protein [Streptacidiphilus jiangxiensis]|uniref:A-factor biosynthesis hotdog domain-containing protein n=1 Tax=Streptacidiphilus jiangxiensis TaxID=235985 RepID=A0A1H7R197_STRJI|nr:A-factor biosynthesis hotdog domain-containing protein [Streptacidiphilus jiangxiensis]